jgi:hypothetical protein
MRPAIAPPAWNPGLAPARTRPAILGRRRVGDRDRASGRTAVTGKGVCGGAGKQERQTDCACGQCPVDPSQPSQRGIAPVRGIM